MAFLTVGFNPERGFVVVASTARFPVFHHCHGVVFVVGTGNVWGRMAIAATVCGYVYRVTEYSSARIEIDLFYRVASTAGILHTESGLAIVAGAARLAFLHVGHAPMPAVLTRSKDTVMAIRTFEQGYMAFVAKKSPAGFLGVKNHINRGHVAFVAVSTHAEGGFPIVAGTTGCALFHFGHGKTFIARAGSIQPVVAIFAGKRAKMALMTEAGIITETDLLDRMTFAAVLFYAKGGFTIVTGSARLTFFHVSHRKSGCGNTGAKDGVMAVTTAKIAFVPDMTEIDDSGILDPKGYVSRCARVAFIAVCRYSESGLAIMTGAAGLALFHLWHGIAHTTGAPDKNRTMAV